MNTATMHYSLSDTGLIAPIRESVISSFPPLPEADLSELLGAIKWVGNKLFIQSVFPCVTHLLWRECEADASLLTRQAAAKKQQHCRSLNKFQRSRDFYNYHMSKSASQQHPLFSSSPESQMPQMLLTDVSIWKESGARELRKGRERHGQIQKAAPRTHNSLLTISKLYFRRFLI